MDGKDQMNLIERLRVQAAVAEPFEMAKEHALDYLRTVADRPVFPTAEAVAALEHLRQPLPQAGHTAQEILSLLHRYGSPATVAQTGGRYFGFVNGGVLPAALAARWLVDVWDQNAALYVMSPAASVLEEVCEQWLVDLLGLPSGTAAGFVGGSSAAMLCGLAAGRNHLLSRQGYDVTRQGIWGAPQLRVVLGEGAHSTIYKALSLLGMGSNRIVRVPADAQGRICVDQVPALDDRTLLILQAGNVNSGAFDTFEPLCRQARCAGAWVHVDGAFGLWAAASPVLRTLTRGVELADSWSTDAHKTLNAPYDNGILLCRHRQVLIEALHMTGSYIQYSDRRDGMLYSPDMSRRARAAELWACLMSLGREGVTALVEDLHHKALRFAAALTQAGFTIHNDVCFNQVLVSRGGSAQTQRILQAIQAGGECWCGGTQWDGQTVIRISVCSYRTSDEDIDRSAQAFVQAAQQAETQSFTEIR